jgi:hypothetical protein
MRVARSGKHKTASRQRTRKAESGWTEREFARLPVVNVNLRPDLEKMVIVTGVPGCDACAVRWLNSCLPVCAWLAPSYKLP